MGHLTVILGCMFAQKTTELLRYIRRSRSIGYNVLVLNSKKDTRYGNECIASHDEKQEQAMMVESLCEADSLVRSNEYQVVVIDEGQFFHDLFDSVTAWADECPIHVVVAGLDGTFQREPFGDILRLIPHAEEVLRLSALCAECKDGTKAIYSKRVELVSDTIHVGSSESYRPVCRKHYLLI
jgi:thymidine kinase